MLLHWSAAAYARLGLSSAFSNSKFLWIFKCSGDGNLLDSHTVIPGIHIYCMGVSKLTKRAPSRVCANLTNQVYVQLLAGVGCHTMMDEF